MRLRPEAKVGLVVFLAILVLVGVYFFLGGFFFRTARYPIYAIFADAQKLDRGADVRMAGVRIGLVSEVELTPSSRARVNMQIFNGVEIPKDSVAQITTGGLIGDFYVDIMPGSSKDYLEPGDRIASRQATQIGELLEKAEDLLDELQVTATSINEVLGDEELMATLRQSAEQLNQATAAAVELTESAQNILAQLSPEIQRTFENLNETLDAAERISLEVEASIQEDIRPNIRLLTEQTLEAVRNLNQAILQTQDLLARFQASTSKIDEVLTNANQAAIQAEKMLENLNVASEEVRELATDEELQENLRITVRNIAEASEQVRQLVAGLRRRFGVGGPGPTPQQKTAIPGYGITSNILWNTDESEYRVDVNYTFAGTEDSFYRVGAFDLGENTRLNLQKGILLGPRSAFRYGLHASDLSIGFDQRIGSTLFSADLFEPNDPDMEVRGVLGISDSFGLYGGVRNVFDDDERDVLIGIRYNK